MTWYRGNQKVTTLHTKREYVVESLFHADEIAPTSFDLLVAPSQELLLNFASFQEASSLACSHPEFPQPIQDTNSHVFDKRLSIAYHRILTIFLESVEIINVTVNRTLSKL